jgi:ubiquinol-cytochrome c reductase cytochrome b subunit
VTHTRGEAKPFYPYHALKDTIVVAVVFVVLLTLSFAVHAPLDSVADPADASYIPRPEWYFLSLFQLLKYFPGRLEPIATMVIPGLVIGALLLLPFLDRTRERRPLRRPLVTTAFAVGLGLVGALTWLGFRDTPPSSDANAWTPLSIAGYEFSQDRRCTTCHRVGGAGSPLSQTVARKDPGWLIGHVRDPQMVAPGLRPIPPGGMNETQAQSVLAYMRRVRRGADAPAVSPELRSVALVFGRFCGTCHLIDGEGGTQGPDLSHVGSMRDAKWLREWITDPTTIKLDANMPAFGDRLNEAEMTAIVAYLAERK